MRDLSLRAGGGSFGVFEVWLSGVLVCISASRTVHSERQPGRIRLYGSGIRGDQGLACRFTLDGTCSRNAISGHHFPINICQLLNFFRSLFQKPAPPLETPS